MENHPYGHSPSSTSGDGNDFFGGAVLPHSQHTKEYADFTVPTTARPPTGSTSIPKVLIAVAAVVVLALGFLGYRTYFTPTIEMPEELLGMERTNLDTTVSDTITDFNDVPGLGGEDVDLHMGMYASGSQMLLVVAGEAGSTSQVDVEQFFASIDESMRSQMPGVTLEPSDAGEKGGTMRCFETVNAGATMGACAWLSEDTFGMVVEGPLSTDIAQRTRDVRSEIES